MANYGKRLGYPIRVAGLGVNKLLALLAVLLLCTHSWGACQYKKNWMNYPVYYCYSSYCSDTPDKISDTYGTCADVVQGSGGYYYTQTRKVWDTYCRSASWANGQCSGYIYTNYYSCYYDMRCDTQAEADSAYCAQNPTAEGCGNCKAADTTWLNAVVDSCNAAYGENSFALVDTNDVCEHRGRCCPMDSVVAGNSCAYRCDSIAGVCTNKNGNLLVSVLRDTTMSGVDSTFYNKCYYNCAYAYNRDSSTALVLGNINLGGPSSSIADGNKAADDFSSIRSVYSGLYVYDYLSPETYEWVDSLAMAPCAVGMYRGIKNGKYVYWKAGQPVPDSVTNVVKIK